MSLPPEAPTYEAEGGGGVMSPTWRHITMSEAAGACFHGSHRRQWPWKPLHAQPPPPLMAWNIGEPFPPKKNIWGGPIQSGASQDGTPDCHHGSSRLCAFLGGFICCPCGFGHLKRSLPLASGVGQLWFCSSTKIGKYTGLPAS